LGPRSTIARRFDRCIRMPAALVACGVALAGALFGAHLIATTPLAVVLRATLPPALAAALLMLARRRDGVFAPHLVAFAWGAIAAAPLSAAANDALSAWIGASAGEAAARTLVPALVGPIVEEVAKLVGLVAILALEPRAMRGVVAGMVAGALVGLGFTLTENVDYMTLAVVQGGAFGLDRALWLRGVLGGFTHAVFAATIGAGIGWSRERPLRWVPAAAFSAAVAQHALWNAFASPRITEVLCNPIAADGPCRDGSVTVTILLSVVLVIAAGLTPGVLFLSVLAARTRRRPG
jgi:RsiW-degrading membrane proteinase PrsW (M82 family)